VIPKAFQSINRRTLLQLGLAGLGVSGAALAFRQFTGQKVIQIPPFPKNAPTITGLNPLKILREFDYGTVKQEGGRTIREFQITAGTSTLELELQWASSGANPAGHGRGQNPGSVFQ
jgi:manganese oxidase